MNRKEVLALIEKIIEEHKIIIQKVQTLEQVANDAAAIINLEKAKEAFMPGRLENKEGLKKLEELLEIIAQGIQAHFHREETGLMPAVEEYGDKELASALCSLLLEHVDLRNRFAQSQKHIVDLTGGSLSHHLWEATAYDMRAHITHTRELFKAHAEIEQELMRTLRNRLRED